MQELIHGILKKYWGYDHFRPLQAEIICHILTGHDALALLPTGGGKSICFQVPTLAMEGLCVVVSPLIALMKDQVEQLNRRGIRASAIYSGMSNREIDICLDNCLYAHANPMRFLYVSPERLQTDLFKARAAKMRICLLAVDEAHCISQWGYDFRPPYLEIARFREHIGMHVPCLALTATATPEVQQDIQEKLLFRKGSRVFQKSFLRDNLSYSVFETEDAPNRLLRILYGVPGSSVVYANTRRETEQIAQWLQQNRINAQFYHAGLPAGERSARQEWWIKDKIRVMVATNAFGMGIDKPDVRSVIHLLPPASLEAYYQEAGRGGRDGEKAYAVLLYPPQAIDQLVQKVAQNYPDEAVLAAVYQRLANYLQLSVDVAPPPPQDFDIEHFLQTCKQAGIEMPSAVIFQALNRLEELGLIQRNDSADTQDKFIFQTDFETIYRFQIAHANFEALLKYLLRHFGGNAFASFTPFSVPKIAAALRTRPEQIVQQLQVLEQQGIVSFVAARTKPQISFTMPRMRAGHFQIDRVFYRTRKEQAMKKALAMIGYLQAKRCRQQVLLAYFGEQRNTPCGICDNCLAAKKQLVKTTAESYQAAILKTLSVQPMFPEELLRILLPDNEELFADVLRNMLASQMVRYVADGRIAAC
ncbi:MAG: ATP-dependent DNA helicase RecQ [Cytophagales bacterium]|nr:RecQ family ATP-dependent DNA helicase [Bernardetiaceae bacterium]MDW8203696.1 ATP-dependent DNA helicase RecQ [Cytophagales bacterium]